MLNGLANPVLIVDPDVGDSPDIRANVDEYQRNLTVTKVFDQGFFHAKREDRYPVHAAFDHAPHRRLHALRVMHCRGEQDLVVVFDREILERLYDLGKKWIGELRDDQAKNAASSENQGARLSVGVVTEFVDHLPHPLGELRIDRRHTVDGSGYGGGGDFRFASDLTNIHGLLRQENSMTAAILP